MLIGIQIKEKKINYCNEQLFVPVTLMASISQRHLGSDVLTRICSEKKYVIGWRGHERTVVGD